MPYWGRSPRSVIAVCVVLGAMALVSAPAQGREEHPTTVTVQTIVPTGMPLAFDSVSVTSEQDQGNRGLLKLRVTSKAAEKLTTMGIGYTIFRPDKSVRGGGFDVERVEISAGSWLERWVLLENEVQPGDRVVVTINEASSESTAWKVNPLTIAKAARTWVTGGTLSVPSVQTSAVSK
jgi:hypothetical protein